MKSINIPLEAVLGWDIKNWSKTLAFWQKYTNLDLANCRVLEIGAMKGGLSLYLATMGAVVVCSDFVMLGDEVKIFHKQHDVDHRIIYSVLDVVAIPFFNDSFDCVVFKSVLGALRTKQKQEMMLREIYRILKPGGELWFAENLAASPLHRFFRNFFVPWGRYWRYVYSKEISQFCQRFSSIYLENYGFLGAFGRSEKQRSFLGFIDACINRWVPSQWKYIVFGLARK